MIQAEKKLPEGLEEAAEKASKTWRRNEDGTESKELFPQAFVRGFIAGAEWQKKIDDLETADLLAIAHLQGMEQQKSKMMEEAVETSVYGCGDEMIPEIAVELSEGYKPGDKVRVIVIPNTDEK